jgi:hypothetical protein
MLRLWERDYVDRLSHFLVFQGILNDDLVYGSKGSLYGRLGVGEKPIVVQVKQKFVLQFVSQSLSFVTVSLTGLEGWLRQKAFKVKRQNIVFVINRWIRKLSLISRLRSQILENGENYLKRWAIQLF